MPNYTTEIAIIGGGISGLWLLNLLRSQGYDACLFERGKLGSAQTFASQGMIHGGIKYTLGGFTTPASETIAAMPETWRQCMNGSGPVDLTGLKTLSDDYFLFSDGALSGKVTAFFASKSLRGRVNQVPLQDRPDVFQDPKFKGQLYKLQDMVIDTRALLEILSQRYSAYIFQAEPKLQYSSNGPILELDSATSVQANYYVFAAGEGNGELIHGIPKQPVEMQIRPLKQVMVKGNLPKMFAHAVSLKDANKPRLTITTHPMPDGTSVWYLGGNLAEQGVSMTDDEVIAKAKSELKKLLPWVPTADMEYATLDINRAEPAQASGARPDLPFVKVINDLIVCWPTKLTLTPLLGEEVLKALPAPRKQPHPAPQLPLATLAAYPWELAFA